MRPRHRILALLSALGLGLVVVAMLPGGARPQLAQRAGPALGSVRTWGYQLQGARPDFVMPDIDLVVIDHARDASVHDLFTARDVEAFRQRAGKPDRLVLAYMSIGEAEIYRFYWWRPWVSPVFGRLLKPSWLARENKEWKGNYLVRYWQTGWQQLIVNPRPPRIDQLRQKLLGAPRPYIDQVLEAGFDGVYLDRVDAFAPWEKTLPAAQAEMSAFVGRISAYAKARKPGFLIVPQNGEELAQRPEYLAAIDGMAKEDLVFGLDGGEGENSADDIAHATEHLQRGRRAGKPVLVVEYVGDAVRQQRVLRHTAANGFVAAFAGRDLNLPPMLPLHPSISNTPAPQR